ncbi:GntR family transcriptional regulator/MocR family aminotransferase [Kitasatospora sp. MAA4]|uniref:MocR-like pyridoxine biosynthesis transcription factor PdxR n=1 Tax=Kitasatospora sp. MAA4 TaxID=3035093 RepID=UPI0024750A58|nr:PLP-dependent aminotransferase family protein [Kitasatospora sp. MAA4]MDH6136294.1 GntR family transcriptional regulator/MocR family aminotransferase [Kitasatospora sp. MAA4]
MNSWATWGQDLHLDLSERRARGLGLRAALEDALREAAAGASLAPGTRLPSSRVLAADLGIARNTVAEAYAQLAAEGWLTSRQGSGTTVADRAVRRGGSAPAPRSPDAALRYDLRAGRPDLDLFPHAEWLAATRRALASAPRDALGYSDPRGRIELRQALADYLGRVRGVRTDPERLLLTSGYAQGLSLLSAELHARDGSARGGRPLAVEAYGLAPHRAVITAAGPATVPLPVDEDGARTDLLARSGAGAVLLTPAHQFPTGALLHPARRAAAVDWARETGGLVIEDDYDGEFRYDRQAVGAMQALDPERVVYAGSASKSLAPGLRLGWLALPVALVEPMRARKAAADGQSGVLEQLALAELIRSGGYDRQVRRARLHYRRRRDRVAALLAERAPEVRVTGISAGLHAVLRLPDGLPGGLPAEEVLVERAYRRGLGLEALDSFRHPLTAPDGPDALPPSLVIGFGTPPDRAFGRGLEVLGGLLGGE